MNLAATLPTLATNLRDGNGDIETLTWAPHTGDGLIAFTDFAGHRIGVLLPDGDAMVLKLTEDGKATTGIPTVHDNWTAALMSLGYVAVSDEIIVVSAEHQVFLDNPDGHVAPEWCSCEIGKNHDGHGRTDF